MSNASKTTGTTWTKYEMCSSIVQCARCWMECSFAFMFNDHDGDTIKRTLQHRAMWTLQLQTSAASLSVSGKTTYTPWLSLCLFCFKDNSSTSIVVNFLDMNWAEELNVIYYTTEKNYFCISEKPSFLIYQSLHLNMFLFALCTCCLYTRQGKNPTTWI